MADSDYDKRWHSVVETEFSAYMWFESLANALNSEMKQKVPAENYRELLLTISAEFRVGMDDVKTAIDVAFVENLFWQVPESEAAAYWEVLPSNLQALYVGFHGRKPL